MVGYELVQVKRRKFCPPRMPLAPCSRISHVKYHTDRHALWKRVTWPVFFCSGPRTGASGESVSPPTAGPQQRSVMVRRFRGKTGFFRFFFSERADCTYS